jgi:hypothetical protein
MASQTAAAASIGSERKATEVAVHTGFADSEFGRAVVKLLG